MRRTPPHRIRVLTAGVAAEISLKRREADGVLEVLGNASTPEEAALLAKSLKPDVVLIQRTMAHLAPELEQYGVVVVEGQSTDEQPTATDADELERRLPHDLIEAVVVLGWLGARRSPTGLLSRI